MARFQLVFRDSDGERSEIRDSNTHDEPQIDGRPLVDGTTCVIWGVEWLVRREDIDDMPRFVCSVVAAPAVVTKIGARPV